MGLTNLRTYSSNSIRSYNQIIGFYYECAYSFDQKWAAVPDYDENRVGCQCFWNLYKKRARNVEAQNEWNRLFAKANVWKHPTTGVWRLYFNLEKEDIIAVKKQNQGEAEKLHDEIQELINQPFEEFNAKADNIEICKEVAEELKIDVDFDKIILGQPKQVVEKLDKKVAEDFEFTSEQLKAIKNL